MAGDSQFTIEHLRLTLPPGLVGRADAIARQVAAQLSRTPLSGSGRVPRIRLPPFTLQPGETDTALASRIARAIHVEVRRELAGGAAPVPAGPSPAR